MIYVVLFSENCRSEVSRFGKNFVPILLNLFTADPESERDSTRLAVLETLKTYLQIVDTPVGFVPICK